MRCRDFELRRGGSVLLVIRWPARWAGVAAGDASEMLATLRSDGSHVGTS
ncbi:hypothetical protein RRSWK_05638 [Rhodopirellula sp. SWK7]|nr:hypothetical protein RRSWK_05638 [Rhodopirellula sp. SWK7]